MLDSIFGKQGYRRFDDSYALTRPSLFNSLRDSIENRAGPEQVIFLVAHFTDVFTELQDALESWNLPYDIITQVVNERWLEQVPHGTRPPVFLTMAEMLATEMSSVKTSDTSLSVAMMIVERHPLGHYDQKIESFARQLPCPVELGYFLAMDDEIMKQFINQDMILLLKQLGLREHDLVTSHMVTRRLNRATKKMAKRVKQEQTALSASEWFRLNHVTEEPSRHPTD
ncbi:MAG: hypothetical protein MK108_04230 [Mariniblastus sp.]|nr:hypothetical protein [Mariniblastus sp.]